MSIDVWPADLPLPGRSDYSQSWQEARLARPADAGPPSYRRRTSAVARPVTLSMRLYRSQKAVFDQFYADTVCYGAKPFTMPDPTTDGWPLLSAGGVPVLTEEGTPILLSAQWLCLFGDTSPQVRVDGLRFRVSFSIWVMP
ncbi:hypothetical protein [Puniceibacterium confluentis]|uniref:hypothetical protein n=1 Tax=Puniceibacterium confluentis TaxID=1958944 RepID=UPI0011B556B9|nr:hypothetical protein [Puniceibacterium confluentis]